MTIRRIGNNDDMTWTLSTIALLCVWSVFGSVGAHQPHHQHHQQQRSDAPRQAGDLGLCIRLSPPAARAQAAAPLRSAAAAEPAYQNAFWGRVAFDAVPPFEINTHDPTAQDVYISGSVHRGERWDPFLWALLVYVLLA